MVVSDGCFQEPVFNGLFQKTGFEIGEFRRAVFMDTGLGMGCLGSLGPDFLLVSSSIFPSSTVDWSLTS